jgi:hypothetical protein
LDIGLNGTAIKQLQDRIPGLLVASAGGVKPYRAEGELHGLPWRFRYQQGRASLKVGGDAREAPLYDAQCAYGLSMALTLDTESFVWLMMWLVPRLKRAPRVWVFEGVAAQDTRRARKGEPHPYSSYAHTPQEALQKITARPVWRRVIGQYVSPPEAWAAEVAAWRINPWTVTVDERQWPDPEPVFLVLPEEGMCGMDLEALPEVQVFAASENVRRARDQWVRAMFELDPKEPEYALECRRQCERIVEAAPKDTTGARVQIGLLLVMALARRAGGCLTAYRSDLEDAYVYASSMGFDDLERALSEALTDAAGS